MASTVTQQRIQQAAARNTELLRTLSETDYATPALAQQRRLIADLEDELSLPTTRLASADRQRTKELKEHKDLQDSVVRRFLYKSTGKKEKFQARAQKEEEEYFAALQTEHRESEVNNNLKARLEEARALVPALEQKIDRHSEAQRQLESLYNDIFAGSTPGFPDEDERERVVNNALQAYQDYRGRLETEHHTVLLLNQGQTHMRSAVGAMDEALRHSRNDIWGGGTLTDMIERNALHRAEMQASQARLVVMQAQRMNPLAGSLPEVSIDQGNLMADVFFDNIFTDLAFHDKIKASSAQVQQVAAVMDSLLAAAQARHQQLEAELRTRDKELQDARFALQKERERAFERVAAVA